MTGSKVTNMNTEARLIEDNERIEKTIILDQGILGAEGDLLVFGVITASDKLMLCDSTAIDGSDIPRYILLVDTPVDTTADVTRMVVTNGKVNAKYLVFGGTDDIDTKVGGVTHFDSLRAAKILALDYKSLN